MATPLLAVQGDQFGGKKRRATDVLFPYANPPVITPAITASGVHKPTAVSVASGFNVVAGPKPPAELPTSHPGRHTNGAIECARLVDDDGYNMRYNGERLRVGDICFSKKPMAMGGCVLQMHGGMPRAQLMSLEAVTAEINADYETFRNSATVDLSEANCFAKVKELGGKYVLDGVVKTVDAQQLDDPRFGNRDSLLFNVTVAGVTTINLEGASASNRSKTVRPSKQTPDYNQFVRTGEQLWPADKIYIVLFFKYDEDKVWLEACSSSDLDTTFAKRYAPNALDKINPTHLWRVGRVLDTTQGTDKQCSVLVNVKLMRFDFRPPTQHLGMAEPAAMVVEAMHSQSSTL